MLNSQHIFLENRERISLAIKKYPNVISVGVGLKETGKEITSTLCYRVYVSEKKFFDQLQEHEIIPAEIEGFATDVIDYGVVEEMAGAATVEMDNGTYRPVTGGIQIKNDLYVGKSKRGGGTLGCLAILNDDEHEGLLVGLTCQHVVAYNSSSDLPEGDIGQPWKRICCCFWTKDVIGTVYDSRKDRDVDCAIIKFHQDIVDDINNNGSNNGILEIGHIKGKYMPVPGDNVLVKKRGIATRVTHGRIVDFAFDGSQLLIAPVPPSKIFADFGDSGAIVLTEDDLVIGLLWGTKRDRFKSDDPENIPDEDPRSLYNQQHRIKERIHGVVTPIEAVETALKIKIPMPPSPVPTISVYATDANTYIIPSTLPESKHPKKHFVSVRKTEINTNDVGDDIILQVSFNEPVDPDRVRWISSNPDKDPDDLYSAQNHPDLEIISPAIGTDKLTAKISRKINKGARCLVGVKVDNSLVGEAYVWIVWSAKSEAFLASWAVDDEGNIIPESDVDGNDIFKDNGQPLPTIVKTTMTNSEFSLEVNLLGKFSIEPASIIPIDIDNEDVPDLRGPNNSPPPNVSDTDIDVFQKGADLGSGAKYKWDGSKSMRCIISRGSVLLPMEIKYNKAFPKYPGSPLVGNDDTFVPLIEQELTPYTSIIEGSLNPRGKIFTDNTFFHSISNSLGYSFPAGNESEISYRVDYRFFARVELGNTWYIISDFVPWRMEWTYKKQARYKKNGVSFSNVWFFKGKVFLTAENNDYFDDPLV